LSPAVTDRAVYDSAFTRLPVGHCSAWVRNGPILFEQSVSCNYYVCSIENIAFTNFTILPTLEFKFGK